MGAPLQLTATEAALLDGKVSPEAQAVVSRALDALSLSELGETQAAMVAAILATAREKGRLTFSQKPIRSCPCCRRTDGYWPVVRNTRYKVKGRPDFDRPKTFMGWDLDSGFVTVQHHIGKGFCQTCRPAVEPVLRERLSCIPCDTPAYWPGMPRRYARWDNMKCKDCGWEGHEGEMRPLRTIMGGGYYQGGCPNCPATNGFSYSKITRTEGWTLVPLATDGGSQTPPASNGEGSVGEAEAIPTEPKALTQGSGE